VRSPRRTVKTPHHPSPENRPGRDNRPLSDLFLLRGLLRKGQGLTRAFDEGPQKSEHLPRRRVPPGTPRPVNINGGSRVELMVFSGLAPHRPRLPIHPEGFGADHRRKVSPGPPGIEASPPCPCATRPRATGPVFLTGVVL
jgi:hypothetical protein